MSQPLLRTPALLASLLASLLLGVACTGKGGGSSCPSDPVDGATATVDGESWTASLVTWQYAGDSVQVISTSEDKGWFSVVAQSTTTGATPAAALEAGDLPVEITLKTGPDGGFATWYSPENQASATTQGGEGTLVLSDFDGDALTGCLSFTAGEGGADVSFEDGQFTAEMM